MAVRVSRRILHKTSLVAVRLVETVGADHSAGLGAGRRRGGGVRAAVQGVECVLIVGRQIDVFDDVDFAVVWPVGSLGPEGRPDGALELAV